MLHSSSIDFTDEVSTAKEACALAFANSDRHHFFDGTPEQLGDLIDEQMVSYQKDLVARMDEEAEDPASDTLLSANVTKFIFENGVFASPQVFVARFTKFSWKAKAEHGG
jgi:hypothetical protein